MKRQKLGENGLPKWHQWERICLLMQKAQETWVPALGQEDPLEKEMATYSSILAWEIPRTEEHRGLQSLGVTES